MHYPTDTAEATDLADNPAEDNTNYVSYNTMNCDRGANDDMIFDTHMSYMQLDYLSLGAPAPLPRRTARLR